MFGFREIKIEDAKKYWTGGQMTELPQFINSDVDYHLDAQKTWLKNSFC